ncbi:MAG: hypothetical protein HWD63_11585 [Candidatus Parvibacillus calidus]|nr:MAG: hypothetical protein HWD63_11585 [Candidatus Parvibacillus calidus]
MRTTSSNTGQLNISVGLPTVGNDNNGYTSHYNNVLANFTIVYDASGVITSLKRRSLGSDVNITSGIPFSEDANQTIEIYCNNRSTATTYKRGGNTYNLDPQKWDLWVDGTLVLDDAERGNSLGANANISAFAFLLNRVHLIQPISTSMTLNIIMSCRKTHITTPGQVLLTATGMTLPSGYHTECLM